MLFKNKYDILGTKSYEATVQLDRGDDIVEAVVAADLDDQGCLDDVKAAGQAMHGRWVEVVLLPKDRELVFATLYEEVEKREESKE